ncbi:unnamed protein product [Schistocephalus solidus]|uniref:PX domain-containing protein n=1 Tax=Schistocephalus solidus TaxID=70667 RepID=A0A3P7DDW9_SCHSO|nr:unnamed protein product [Schistocephalus solidus]
MANRLANLPVTHADISGENRWCQLRDTIQSTALDDLGRARRQHQDWFDDNDAAINALLVEKKQLHKAYIDRPTAANKTAFYRSGRLSSDFADPSGFFQSTVPIGGVRSFPPNPAFQSRLITEPGDSANDVYLQVEISDALSDKDRVFFTVRTKTNLPEFKKQEFQVNRVHDEFIWLHDQFEENEAYAGLIVSPNSLKVICSC